VPARRTTPDRTPARTRSYAGGHSGGGISAGGGPVLPVARRPGVGAEILLPNTGPVAVTAGLGAFGAWTTMDTPAHDTYLTRLQARRILIPGSGGNENIEFGYGAGPTALDAVRGVNTINDPTGNDTGWLGFDLNTYTVAPAGQALKARVWDNYSAASWEVWACGWDGAPPLFTTLRAAYAAGAGRYYPSNTSGGLAVTASAFPNYGAWVEVFAAAPNDLIVSAVTALNALAQFTASVVAYQLGIGAAGTEEAVGTFLVGHGLTTINCDPPVLVLAGERLAIRATSNGASNRTVGVKVIDL